MRSQVEIEEQDRPKAGFVTPDYQRQYRRLTFGFASNLAVFKKLIVMLLGGMKRVSALGYVNDIIVYGDTREDHLCHLRIFAALRRTDLRLHPPKCVSGAEKVKYFGHIVSREAIRAYPSRIRAILHMPRPSTAEQLQRFVGKCQHYRKLIPNFSQSAGPLFRGQNRTKNFEWTPDSRYNFNQPYRRSCRYL